MLAEKVSVIIELADAANETQFKGSLEAAIEVFSQVSLNGASAKVSEPGDFHMGDAFGFQPKDFEFLLDVRMGVGKALLADESKVFIREGKCTHGNDSTGWSFRDSTRILQITA